MEQQTYRNGRPIVKGRCAECRNLHFPADPADVVCPSCSRVDKLRALGEHDVKRRAMPADWSDELRSEFLGVKRSLGLLGESVKGEVVEYFAPYGRPR